MPPNRTEQQDILSTTSWWRLEGLAGALLNPENVPLARSLGETSFCLFEAVRLSSARTSYLWLRSACGMLCYCRSKMQGPQNDLVRFGSVIVIVVTNQDSTSSRLLPGSSYICCIRNLHALVHKQCHPVHITTAHEILQRRKWQLCKSTLPPTAVAGHEKSRWASSSTGRSCILKAAHRLQPRANQTTL
jgi:hypothetical protein